MSLAVLRQSLRQVRRTIGVLALGSGAFYYLVLFSSSSFLSGPDSAGFFRNPPKAMSAFLGGSADFLHPAGWLALSMNHPVTIALMVGAAMVVSSGAVATEIERGSIDLVLSHPVGRTRFLAAKAAASVFAVTAAQLGGLAGVLVARTSVTKMDRVAIGHVLRAFLGSWVLFVSFAMVATLVSARSSLRGRAIGISVGAIVGWFFLNFIALLIDGVGWMRYASPFHYFQAGDFIAGKPMAGDVLVLAGLGLAGLGGAVWSFARRDLTR